MPIDGPEGGGILFAESGEDCVDEQGAAGGAEAGQAIAKVSYSHDALIDLILANPQVTQRALAKQTGYSEGWLSRVIASDAFQERLASRRGNTVEPLIAASLDERLRAVGMRSADVLMDKLDQPNPPAALAVEGLKLTSRALAYGVRPSHRRPEHLVQVNVNQQVAAGVLPPASSPSPELHAEVLPVQERALPALSEQPAATPLSASFDHVDLELQARAKAGNG